MGKFNRPNATKYNAKWMSKLPLYDTQLSWFVIFTTGEVCTGGVWNTEGYFAIIIMLLTFLFILHLFFFLHDDLGQRLIEKLLMVHHFPDPSNKNFLTILAGGCDEAYS